MGERRLERELTPPIAREAARTSRGRGKIVWRGSSAFTAIGPREEKWDEVFVAEYPSMEHFFKMLRNPEYRENAVIHRQAAVADSRLIRIALAEPGEFFEAS
jgi:uncharacterized protein (DUF1330 family)